MKIVNHRVYYKGATMKAPEKVEPIKGGWAAFGKGWAVHGRSKEEALERYKEALERHRMILAREKPSPSPG